MIYTVHARERMAARGITESNVAWAMEADFIVQPDGRRRYARSFPVGNRLFVITDHSGTKVITVWVRGQADSGV